MPLCLTLIQKSGYTILTWTGLEKQPKIVRGNVKDKNYNIKEQNQNHVTKNLKLVIICSVFSHPRLVFFLK